MNLPVDPLIHISTLDWLLVSDAWIEYRTRLDLLNQAETEPEVRASRQALLADLRLQLLVQELASWPGTPLASHKSAGQLIHKLAFLADLGLKASDPGMALIIERILAHQDPDGPFQLPMNISTVHGGSGQEQYAWALCDAPISLYALVKFGLGETAAVRKAIDYLAGLVQDFGWPCAVSQSLGKWRGPGRKNDPCPYANLVMLKLLAQLPDWNDSSASRIGVETLLGLWQHSLERHPYIFYMGDDFRKLKAPFIWYDLLHVLEVLSQFPWLRQDSRLLEMFSVALSQADANGRFTPVSIWKAWGAWDFGQKKAPSPGLTFFVWRIARRLGLL